MSESTLLNMTEAAKMVGMKRPTFYRKVKEMNVSTIIDQNGKQKVEAAELIRVFGSDVQMRDNPPKKPVPLKPKASKTKQTSQNDIELVQLKAQLEKEIALREQSQEQVEYLKSQLEIERAEKNKANMVLTDQRQKTERAEEWSHAFKLLEAKVTNQEQTTKATRIKAQKILRQNQLLKKTIATERKKSIWKKLFG